MRKLRSTTRSIFPCGRSSRASDLLDRVLGDLGGDGVVVRAQVVPQEVLVPLLLDISALPRQMNQTRGQFSGASGSSTENLRSRFFSARRRAATISRRVGRPAASAFRDDVEAVLVELRIERQPAVAHRAHLRVHRVAAGQRAGRLVRRHGVVVGEGLLVAPLVGVHVVPARRVLQPRGRDPVLGEGDGAPRLGRAPASPGRRSGPGRRRSCPRSRRTSGRGCRRGTSGWRGTSG